MKNISILLLFLLPFFASAQCGFSTSADDAWLSCQVTNNPIPDYGQSHWIHYDLGYEYNLGTVKMWNYNVPGSTDLGYKNVLIDISTDGTNWTNVADFELAEAPGTSDYDGQVAVNLFGASARYIVITAGSTWKNNYHCGGFSEVRFDLTDPVSQSINFNLRPKQEINIYPNPARERIFVSLKEIQPKRVLICDLVGNEILEVDIYNRGIDVSGLVPGMYVLKVETTSGEVLAKRFIRAE